MPSLNLSMFVLALMHSLAAAAPGYHYSYPMYVFFPEFKLMLRETQNPNHIFDTVITLLLPGTQPALELLPFSKAQPLPSQKLCPQPLCPCHITPVQRSRLL